MKSISLKLTLLIAVTALMWTGCDTDGICERGKGTRISQEIALPPFTGIDLQISGDVYLTQGETQSVEIVGQENIVSLLNLDVSSSGIWDIGFTECVRKAADFDIYITVPDLNYVALSGSGNIEGQNLFDVTDMTILLPGSGNIAMEMTGNGISSRISGSGNISLILDADYLESNISGSGDQAFSGEVTTHNSTISGSGNIKAFELITENTNIVISGSGSADVFASTKLDVRISGSGNVNYKGTPAINTTITGSGSVINAN